MNYLINNAMKLSQLLVLLTLIASGSISATSPKKENKIIDISLLNFAPLHNYAIDGEGLRSPPGYAAEIYTKIFEQAGYKVKFHLLPFNRGMLQVSKGHLDALSGPLKFDNKALEIKSRHLPEIGPLYGKLIYPQNTIGVHHSSCVFVRSDSKWDYSNFESLDQKSIGLALHYDYGSQMNLYLEKRAKINDSRLIMLTGDNVFSRLLRLLVRKRIDIILMDKVSGQFAIKSAIEEKQIKEGLVRLSGCSGVPASLYLAFSGYKKKQSKQLADIFDNGIISLRESGELNKILSKYGITDWEARLSTILPTD